MTSARNVFVAERWTTPSACPIGVYGPTMNISSRPITSGGSSRLQSTPASQTGGTGSVPRASFQASGVPRTISTASVTPPASADTRSGSSAPGADSELPIACQDRCVSKVISGPRRANQMTPAPATDANPDTERMARGPADARSNGPGPRCPGPCCPDWAPRTAPPAAAAGLAAQLTLHGCGNRAASADPGRQQQRESARLVLGQARRQRVLHERDRGRGGLADDGDVDHLRRAALS